MSRYKMNQERVTEMMETFQCAVDKTHPTTAFVRRSGIPPLCCGRPMVPADESGVPGGKESRRPPPSRNGDSFLQRT